MLYYALMFLVVGLIAGALNLAGVSTVAIQISWILFLIGIVLVAMLVLGVALSCMAILAHAYVLSDPAAWPIGSMPDMLTMVGFIILLGAELFTNGIEWFGHRLNLAEGAVGSVLAAVATAMPETLIPALDELEGESRVEEIARMLGGARLTDRTRDHAREMLDAARTAANDKATSAARGKGSSRARSGRAGSASDR